MRHTEKGEQMVRYSVETFESKRCAGDFLTWDQSSRSESSSFEEAMVAFNGVDRPSKGYRAKILMDDGCLDAACVLSDGSAASEARMLALRAMSSGEPERFRDILSFVDREMAGNSSGTQAVTSMLMQDSCRRPYGIERVRKGYYRLIDPEDYWWIDLDQIKISSDMDFEG